MRELQKFGQTSGYITISTVLVLIVVLVILTISTGVATADSLIASLSRNRSEAALAMVEGCIADALMRLQRTNTIPASITTPLGSCTVTTDAQVGQNWTFTVTGTLSGYTKTIQVQATRSTTVSVTGWTAL